MTTVLVIGATGQIGRVVVEEALVRGLQVRAQSRSAARARRQLPAGAEVVEAQPTSAEALRPLVLDIDAVVLTHGADVDQRGGRSFYDIVAAVLTALKDRPEVAVGLMTSMRTSIHPPEYDFVSWKRRAERLLRAAGHPYTIVRPGWFNYQAAGDHRIVLLQGDLVTEQRGVDPHHVAQTLLGGFLNVSGQRRTVEVFSAPGEATTDLEEVFAQTRPDPTDALDGVLDADHVALTDEPQDVQADIECLRAGSAGTGRE